jgi:hypothetical protein
MTIVNDNSRVVNKLEASLTDDARVIIYDRHMLIVQATELYDTFCTCFFANVCNKLEPFDQGTLTEGEGSLWLTSFH